MTKPVELPSDVAPWDGELVRSWHSASHAQRRARLMGGHLYVTTKRLLFHPFTIEAAQSADGWWARLDELADVDRQERRLREALRGGLSARLRIELRDGNVEMFVVKQLDDIIAEIRARR